MAFEIRILRYAKEHVSKAESLLVELKSIDRAVLDAVNQAEKQYRNATVHGRNFVPIEFMEADNEFKRQQFRYELLQSKVLLNLTLSFTFCSELIHAILENQQNEGYIMSVKLIIDRIIYVATESSMRHANLAPLASAVARTESMILLRDNVKLSLIKRNLLKFRNEIS